MEKCAFNSAKHCDNLCNNCPKTYYNEIEQLKKSGKYKPLFAIVPSRQTTIDHCDFESAILEKQEHIEMMEG